ncbi:MAG: protein-glutamate O-methyltransferase CheR [Bacteroidales bacterium]|nr:protein-glutamate O-methyltransferase CheR [Bacteroidales bacterium]
METDTDKISATEISSLLKAIKEQYGYDFCNYSMAHLKRRFSSFMSKHEIALLSELQNKILNDRDFFSQLLMYLSVNTTEMFRDPQFYKSLTRNVFPILHTYPYLKIWHAGCSTGEEVYSMAILLKEANLYDRCQIYATDFNAIALEKAKDGIYQQDLVKTISKNYIQSGGKFSFSNYYTEGYNSILINKDLKKNILFATHNLTVDKVFSEMNIIICRNVLIYFNTELQNHVYNLFKSSLIRGGYLCLGSKESFKTNKLFKEFEFVDSKFRIYKYKYPLSRL